jgi:hypothetical protein
LEGEVGYLWGEGNQTVQGPRNSPYRPPLVLNPGAEEGPHDRTAGGTGPWVEGRQGERGGERSIIKAAWLR